MNNNRFFLSENFNFLMVKFAVYLNRHVLVTSHGKPAIGVRGIEVLL